MSLAEQPDFLSIVEKQMQMTESQGASIRALIEGIRRVHSDVTEKAEKAQEQAEKTQEQVEEMQIMVQEVRDSITLTDAECFQLQYAVRTKSNELTKDRFKDSDEKFNVMVGRHRRMIWSKLKDHFSVAKYSHIRRMDFSDALEFVQNFHPEDYI
ncbi:ORF6C domain-containing protein [Paenibacillus oleatilyticus]|uniref:ORF6C domain-containing protein n=1 Tax=Paenibacillus oleatilyticus TaxID=2594886 RepID=UPI001C200DAA|nr:ORF6C domain-containing protein [Paenibacillus oleatilyticus]MBU7320308.1 ORF6C domain-containing protein [Paenibacillus oleatilyticus]